MCSECTPYRIRTCFAYLCVFRYFDSMGGPGRRYVAGLKQYFVDEVTTREREREWLREIER